MYRLYFTTNSGVYRTVAKNLDTKKQTETVMNFVTYQLFDANTDLHAGILKLSITSTPSDQDDAGSPSLNTYSFSFFLADSIVTTEFCFVASKTTPFPSFRARILSISGLNNDRGGTVELITTPENRKDVVIQVL